MSVREQLERLLKEGVLSPAEFAAAIGAPSGAEDRVGVAPGGDLAAAIRDAPAGGRIALKAGRYRVRTVIDKDLTIAAVEPGVVLLPMEPGALVEQLGVALSDYSAMCDGLDAVRLERDRLQEQMKGFTLNLFRLRSLTKKYKATFTTNNPELAAQTTEASRLGAVLNEALGEASMLSVRGARVRLEGLRFEFPKRDAEAYMKEPALIPFRRFFWHQYHRFNERFMYDQGTLNQSSPPWTEGAGMVGFRGEGDDDHLEVVDCVFDGGGVMTRAICAESEEPEASLTVRSCEIKKLVRHQNFKDRDDSKGFSTREAGIRVKWPAPAHPGDWDRVLLKDTTITRCHSGVYIEGGAARLHGITVGGVDVMAVRVKGDEKHVAHAALVNCTLANEGRYNILGWRKDDLALNYTTKGCTLGGRTGCFHSDKAQETIDAKEAEKRARAAEAKRKKEAAAARKRQQEQARREAAEAARRPAPRAAAPSASQRRASSYPDCEWCGGGCGDAYVYRKHSALFFSYRKGIFCSRKCLKRAGWAGVEGTTHLKQNGQIVPFNAMD